MERVALTNWILAGLLELAFVGIYLSSPRPVSWVQLGAFSVLVAVYLWAAFRVRMDPFSLGSIFIAIVFEAAIYLGWTRSPQLEEPFLLWIASAFPAIFVAVVFLFFYLQREA